MITVGIASIPSRISSLERVLDSIVEQVDQVFVGLNYGLEEKPNYLNKYANVFYSFRDNSNGDAEKFRYADRVEGYFIGWDDDLVMPDGCAAYLVTGTNKYRGLVSLHGRTYPHPSQDFRQWTGNYRCLNTVKEDVQVDLIGSGCCCFHTDQLGVMLRDFKTKNMADLWLSKLATEQGVPMMVLKHAKDYLEYITPSTTIWRDTKNFSEHTRILQSFIK